MSRLCETAINQEVQEKIIEERILFPGQLLQKIWEYRLYFRLLRNSFQMEMFGCENVKPILNSHDA